MLLYTQINSEKKMKQVTIAIVGAGSRGHGYATYALSHQDTVKVVAVADPDDFRRNRIASEHNIPAENVFHTYQEMLERPRLADAVIIATQDKMHMDPVLGIAAKKYDILLEKPMATTAEDCLRINKAVKDAGIIFGVCFVLRYTPYFRKLRELIHSGAIGELVTFRHLEKVGFWHQAHSFVRGNWRNTAESSPMILAKCSHDLDILNFLIGKKCLQISSFGSLKFFKKENQPAGAADRCMQCKYADECTYSAKRYYFGQLHKRNRPWPLNVITNELTEEGVTEALENGPYGRCVFACDNDVVDNQVLNFVYEGGISGNMTMTAFTQEVARESEFRGTHGVIKGDGKTLTLIRFNDQEDDREVFDTATGNQSLAGGHGGGDAGLMNDFIRAVAMQDQSQLGATADEMLAGHLMAFEAEESRLNNQIRFL